MTFKNFNDALTPEKRVLDLINCYFKREYANNKNIRKKASAEILKYFIKTEDGSYTLKSDDVDGKSETMHTHHGAITESLEKFVKPSQLENKNEINVLDICSGLGYNSSVLIEYLDADSSPEIKLNLDMVEISLETMAAGILIPSPLNSHNIVKKAMENHLIQKRFARIDYEPATIPKNISFNIYSQDARGVLPKLHGDYYDAIFLDPFSPAKSPELYTVEFFTELKRVIKKDGILSTYTSAAPVRSGLIEAGFHVGEGPSFGRKSGGTIASPSEKKINKNLSLDDERMIALSDAGIPFRDPGLKHVSGKILFNRSLERQESRGISKFSSAVKTPLFLGKEVELDRNGRRVMRNMNKLGIKDLKSKEALNLICPQYKECICGCHETRPSNSKDRILFMGKRLEKMVSHEQKIR